VEPCLEVGARDEPLARTRWSSRRQDAEAAPRTDRLLGDLKDLADLGSRDERCRLCHDRTFLIDQLIQRTTWGEG